MYDAIIVSAAIFASGIIQEQTVTDLAQPQKKLISMENSPALDKHSTAALGMGC